MNKRNSIFIGVLLLLLSGAVLADNVLKQKVTWSPETLNLPSLAPGQSTTTSAVLTNASLLANQKINGEHLTFQITSGTGTNITATANFPKKIKPGEKVTVTLVVSVASNTPALPPRVMAGKVQLTKNENEKNVFEKPLLVNITISPFLLPPAPDRSLDEATVEGVDSNGNGVRDLTERYIGFTYPDSAKLREGLMQDARVSEAILRDSGDKAATRGHRQEITDYISCLSYLFGHNLDEVDKATGELTANLILDTAARIHADHNANAQFGGMVGPAVPDEVDMKARCSFNPDTLPN